MPIEGFDPEAFSKNLTSQVIGVIPDDISDDDRKFIINIVFKFLVLAADALNKEENSPLSAQQAETITQFIGEWAFHKSVDLTRSGIAIPDREPVLQAVAFAVFDEAKKVIINNVERNEAIARIENRVKESYKTALEKLIECGNIDQNLMKRAMDESNIDKMAQQAQQQAPEEQTESKPVQMPNQLLKLAAISLVLKRMNLNHVEKILSKIDPRDATAISSYMKLDGLETKIDMEKAQKFINEFLMTIPQEAKRISEEITVSRFKQIKNKFPKGAMQTLLNKERALLKSVAQENETTLKDLSPKIVNVLYNYLEGKAVGYSKK